MTISVFLPERPDGSYRYCTLPTPLKRQCCIKQIAMKPQRSPEAPRFGRDRGICWLLFRLGMSVTALARILDISAHL
jgi:hypothetical protein